MRYFNSHHIEEMGVDWPRAVDAIEQCTLAVARNDFAQPIKPYLRYRDPVNRIIAMPAFVGEPFNAAGIKWIASFPKNIDNGVKRAHSVTILNRHDTGQPYATFNTALVSGIRTAAVSGWITRTYQAARALDGLHIGMTGFGPIGRFHLDMLRALLGDRIASFTVYDIRPIDDGALPQDAPFEIRIANHWREAYADQDIFVTCTVSKAPYIDLPPKKGSLQLNVSLRDYQPETRRFMDVILVDDWDEVCRENTDIENMHKTQGLRQEDAVSAVELATDETTRRFGPEQTVMFNPMGMAVYDMAIAQMFYEISLERGVGVELED